MLIGIALLTVLPSSCTCSCGNAGVVGDWNPDLLKNNYRIAFRSTRDGNEMGDLYLMDPDGENVVKIASNLTS
ncbi:hypothetical protein ACFLVP_04285, partial [Chloroflexota bacterium]